MAARITASGANRRRRPLAALLARLLGLAAAPLFLVMAVASAVDGAGLAGFCGGPPAGPVGSMSLMYALMALVHIPVWLRLAAAREERT